MYGDGLMRTLHWVQVFVDWSMSAWPRYPGPLVVGDMQVASEDVYVRSAFVISEALERLEGYVLNSCAADSSGANCGHTLCRVCAVVTLRDMGLYGSCSVGQNKHAQRRIPGTEWCAVFGGRDALCRFVAKG